MQKIFSLSNITLLVALALSSVAAYYSIIGLTAIFAGAVIPVIIMGSILEIGKITTTVWLRKYWKKASWVLKIYLVPAVVALAFLTSMGIFGFLSKAHSDQGMISGDVLAKIAIYDEKIKTSRENIDANRKALKQLDEAVDQVMGRSTDEKGADKAISIRRAQAKDRQRLLQEISTEQKTISQLTEERAPIAAEVRKVEAEVGPIKYIAAFIYGDNPDSNLLERAVRWVIILLVIVFDPLAIALVLAANSSKEWDKEEPEEENKPDPWVADVGEKPTEEEIKAMDQPIETPWPTEWTDSEPDEIIEETLKDIEEEENKQESQPHHPNTHPYLNQGFKYPEDWQFVSPVVYNPKVESNEEEVTDEQVKDIEKKLAVVQLLNAPKEEPKEEVKEEPITVIEEIKTEGVTKENPIINLSADYVSFEGKQMHRDALKELRPDLFKITADTTTSISTNFGTQFPKFSSKGDIFVRVDVLPNRVFKFDGKRWIEVNKEITQTYLQNDDYIQFLISKIDNGEYDVEQLSEKEREQIESFLNASK